MDDDDYDAPDDVQEEEQEEEAGSPSASAAAPAEAGTPAPAQDDVVEPVTASTPQGADKAGGDEEEGGEEGAEEERGDDEMDDALDELFDEDEGAEPASQAEAEADPAAATAAADEPSGTRAVTQDDLMARKKRIMDSLTEQQLDRYESFRRSSLARPKVKKMVTSMLGYAVNDKAIIALCGMGKVFVGELVETARVLAAEEGHHGPLLPRHIHWAYQNLNCERKIPRRQPPKRLLR